MRALLLLLSACSGLPELERVPEAPPRTTGLAASLPADLLRLEDQLEPIRAEAGVPALVDHLVKEYNRTCTPLGCPAR